ncbi:HET-domain-containing protein [Zopfia rhizophila CBS 207.26]|uniref:HET-domain-containing protein n=1 Tax=Zopfia rhizophila CBS 207.26 TaxID=1314779 RepID=A0A6A6DG06_9PEZI|nr:HET-domain-containing protein [Zopfia rhizophila CBS 207.26]
MEYVALSHCWGKHPPTEDSPQFCTTDDNIQLRLKGFSFSKLPKTFQEAVRVTRELDIQYLWIDSLCIIQWNQEDWEHEAKLMEGVFASAYCTIAATSADDSEAGFLQRNVSNECVLVQDASGRRSFRKTYFMLDPNFPDRLLKSGEQRTMEFIHFLFENYSERDLTKETDRCVAISGLEASIARARGCRSRYGIFREYLHRNLLWQRPDGKKTQRIGYEPGSVPSWSWMAYGGGIQFMDILFGDVDWNNELRFNKKPKMEGRHALVTDIGAFRNCSLEQRDTSYAILDLDSNKAERGWIQYDIETSEDLHAERCVVVGRKYHWVERGLSNTKYYILVVRPTSVDAEYRRVGVGWIQSDYVVRERLNVRVV